MISNLNLMKEKYSYEVECTIQVNIITCQWKANPRLVTVDSKIDEKCMWMTFTEESLKKYRKLQNHSFDIKFGLLYRKRSRNLKEQKN